MSIITAAVVFVVFGVKATLAGSTVRISMAVIGCALLALAYVAQAKGKVNLALGCFFAMAWQAFMGANLTFGDVNSLIMAWWVLFVCLAGLLGGRKWVLAWGALSCFSMVLLWAIYAWSEWPRMLFVPENKTIQLRMHLVAQLVVSAAIVRSFLGVTDRFEQQVGRYVQNLEEEVGKRTAAEEQAQNSQKRTSQFFANMSHELRTPLNSILGYSARMMKKPEELSDQTLEALEKIHANGVNLSNLVNEVFEVSSLSTMELQFTSEAISVKSLLGECVSAARVVASEYHLKVDFVCDSDALVQADRTRLHQAFMNVLYFGVRQTHNGGLRVSQACVKDLGARWVKITFTDTSEGLESSQLKTLFDSHYECVLNSNKNLPISALALVISAKTFELHGGRITVTSERFKGTTFTVFLPAQ